MLLPLLCVMVAAHNPCAYRLSDIVVGYGNARQCACVHEEALACKYLKITKAKNNVTALAQAVKKSLLDAPWLKMSENVNVIHVRAGDGIVGPNCFYDKRHCFITNGGGQYGADKIIYDNMSLVNSTACVIFFNTKHCTAHYCDPKHQIVYAKHVIAYFEKRCSAVVVIANSSPDDAFISMATATHFFTTGGRYGKLAATIHSEMKKLD